MALCHTQVKPLLFFQVGGNSTNNAFLISDIILETIATEASSILNGHTFKLSLCQTYHIIMCTQQYNPGLNYSVASSSLGTAYLRLCASFSKVKEILLVLIECASPYRTRVISNIIPEIIITEASSILTLSPVFVALTQIYLSSENGSLCWCARNVIPSVISAVVRSIPVGLRTRGLYILRVGLQRELTLCKEGSVFLPDIFNLYSKAILRVLDVLQGIIISVRNLGNI